MQTTVFRIYSFFRKGLTVLGNFGFRKQYGSENMKCTPRFLEYTVFHQSKVLEKKTVFRNKQFFENSVFGNCGFSEKLGLRKKQFLENLVLGNYGFSEKLGLRWKKKFLENAVFGNYSFQKLRFWEKHVFCKLQF